MCDENHQWTVESNSGLGEPAGEPRCPNGHVAVTGQRHPAFGVAVTAEPLTRITDDVTGRTGWENRYRIVISDLATGELRRSERHFAKEEAFRVVQRLLGTSWDAAQAWLVASDQESRGK